MYIRKEGYYGPHDGYGRCEAVCGFVCDGDAHGRGRDRIIEVSCFKVSDPRRVRFGQRRMIENQIR